MTARTALKCGFRAVFAGFVASVLLLSSRATEAENSAGQSTWRTASLSINANGLPAAPLPQMLSKEDRALYLRIFALQRRGNWDSAAKHIAQIEDPILIGHVLAQKYLHPTAYRSKYKELRRWLQEYADLPYAPRLHGLAKKRKPNGAAAPPPPKVGMPGPFVPDSLRRPPVDLPKKALSNAQRERLRVVQRQMRQRIRKGWPSGAYELLTSTEHQSLASDAEYDAYRARIAKSYYVHNKDARAFELASASAARSGAYVPLAHWTAGLAAWRLERYDEARRHFEAVASATDIASPRLTSAGAFWAARAYLEQGDQTKAVQWMIVAAEEPRTFYGILAANALDQQAPFDFEAPVLTEQDVEAAQQIPAVRRAIALVEIGEIARAERELLHIYPHVDAVLAKALLPLAERLGLPAVQMGLGVRLREPNGRRYDSAVYPLPRWAPKGGFRVDPALIYALIRQESHFRSDAKSRSGARGLMQLMPRTARLMARRTGLKGYNKYSLMEPELNITLGHAYVERLLGIGLVNGSLVRLLAAYNAGPGNLKKWLSHLNHKEDPLLFVESVRWHETRNFIKRVLTNYWIYRTRLGLPTLSLEDTLRGEWPHYRIDNPLYARNE